MSTDSLGPLTAHEYDGIREYDNPTPAWWHVLLLASIVFSVLYAAFWHSSPMAWTIEEAWADEQRAEFARIFGAVGNLNPDAPTILVQMDNPKFMSIARATFQGNCAACHARDGGGLVGVNLCDDFYKNVTKIEDIFRVITDGANNGAMPSWKNRLSDNERVIVASYVASLRGTKPETPKAPEGQPIPPWLAPGTVAPAAGSPKP